MDSVRTVPYCVGRVENLACGEATNSGTSLCHVDPL